MSATSVGEIGLDLVVNQNQFNKQMSGITSLAKKAGAALAGAFAVKKIVDFGKQCLELGSDLQEVQNVVDVTFPHMTAQVDKFAKSAAQSFGLSETMAKRYTGTFGAMAKAFGFTESAAYEMSATLTGLAGDVASFYNLSQDEAYTKLKSVFTGETETLKDLGVVMTQAALDQYALANGYGKTTAAMTEQEKVALRYAFVQQQLSAAQGDFARTSDSWANQTRIMALQLQSIMATIGQGLINLFTPVIKIVNTVLGKIATLANAFKAFTELITGKKSSGSSSVAAPVSELASAADTASSGLSGTSGAADSLADSTKGVGSAAKKAAKEMRALMGFDQIQRLDSQTDTSGGGSSGGSGGSGGVGGGALGSAVDFGSLAEGETVLDEVDSKFQGLIDRCKELARLFKKGFKIGFGDSEKKIQSIQKSIDGIGKSLKEIFTDRSVVAAANNLADQIALSLGKIVGSAANIGLSLADNLLGGVDLYLSQSGDYIKSKIVSILNASSNVANLAGDYAVALAEIFSVVSSPEAKQCTADLIGIFSDGFLGVVNLGYQFASDLFSIVTAPVLNNVDQIKLAFEGIIEPIGVALSTLHTSVLTTFSVIGQMYEQHVRPMVDSFVAGLSSIANTALNAWNTYISPVLDQLAAKFQTVWEEHVQPLINAVIGLIGQLAELFRALWEELIKPAIEDFINNSAPTLGETLSTLGGWFLDLLATVSDIATGIITALTGVAEFLTGVFTQDWETTKQGVSKIVEGLRSTVNTAFTFIRDSVLKPFDDFLSGVFETDFSESFGVLGEVLNTFFDGFETVWNDAKELLNGIISFIEDVFSGDWRSAWQKCVNAFKTVFKGLVNILKTPINGVIALLNGLIGAVNSLLSAIESRLKFDFTIPNPFGGTIVDYHWQAKLPRINYEIPALAQGGFVKPNTPQLAMIGDNRHQGEVVAPEDKLQAMVDEAVLRASGRGGITKEELESIINRAVARIIAALASVGFNLDGEQLATLQRMAQTTIDRRYNTTEIL